MCVIEKLKKDAHHDAEEHHKEEHYEEYGGKKGDDSKSHKDYEESNEEFGGKKGDDSSCGYCTNSTEIGIQYSDKYYLINN